MATLTYKYQKQELLNLESALEAIKPDTLNLIYGSIPYLESLKRNLDVKNLKSIKYMEIDSLDGLTVLNDPSITHMMVKALDFKPISE